VEASEFGGRHGVMCGGPSANYAVDKILPRALLTLELVDCGLTLLLKFGIPDPDNSESSFSVLVFNRYLSGPHFGELFRTKVRHCR
jgi:hypothetical protein